MTAPAVARARAKRRSGRHALDRARAWRELRKADGATAPSARTATFAPCRDLVTDAALGGTSGREAQPTPTGNNAVTTMHTMTSRAFTWLNAALDGTLPCPRVDHATAAFYRAAAPTGISAHSAMTGSVAATTQSIVSSALTWLIATFDGTSPCPRVIDTSAAFHRAAAPTGSSAPTAPRHSLWCRRGLTG